jgi:hypothetical protein
VEPDDRKPADPPTDADPPAEPPADPPADPAAEPPADPPPDAPTTAYPTEPPPSPRRDRFGRVRTFAGHRVTQLVAVLLLGLAIGAGVTALAVDDRDGVVHHQHGRIDRGPDRGPGRGGPDQVPGPDGPRHGPGPGGGPGDHGWGDDDPGP